MGQNISRYYSVSQSCEFYVRDLSVTYKLKKRTLCGDKDRPSVRPFVFNINVSD